MCCHMPIAGIGPCSLRLLNQQTYRRRRKPSAAPFSSREVPTALLKAALGLPNKITISVRCVSL